MARYTGPSCRLCRAEAKKLFLKGERCFGAKCPISKKRTAPGKGPRSRTRKPSNYGIQLREKQKLKRTYGMLERQFRNLFERADRMEGKTGDNLVSLLETRLDNIVYRMRFAASRKQGRQLVSHGHVSVNGRRVTIPSFTVKIDDNVEITDNAKKLLVIKESLKEYTRSGVVPWIEVDPDNMKGAIKAIPRRADVTDLTDINEQKVVELYSK